MRVLKYVLAPVEKQRIPMPEGTKLLHVGEQNAHVVIWALVDDRRARRMRNIFIKGTGHTIETWILDNDNAYIGTVIMTQLGPQQGLVWHIFDGGEE